MKQIISLCALFSVSSFAFNIPSAPNSPSGFDEIRTSDGAFCRSSIGGNLQMYGGVTTAKGNEPYYYSDGNYDESGGFIGFAYSFGSSDRISCARLAEIETEKAQIELTRLKEEIERFKRMRDLQTLSENGVLPELSRTK